MGICSDCGNVVPQDELTLLCNDELCRECMAVLDDELSSWFRGQY